MGVSAKDAEELYELGTRPDMSDYVRQNQSSSNAKAIPSTPVYPELENIFKNIEISGKEHSLLFSHLFRITPVNKQNSIIIDRMLHHNVRLFGEHTNFSDYGRSN